MRLPNKILFEERFETIDSNRLTLFKNKTDLADAIFQLENNSYTNVASLKAILSQVMLPGNSKSHRSLPDKLRELILEAVKLRISSKDSSYNTIENDIYKSFESLKNAESYAESISSQSIEKERLLASRNAESHLIFTTRPAEIIDNAKGERLVDEMLDYLLESGKYYRFFFHEADIAFRFWQKILLKVTELFDKSDDRIGKEFKNPTSYAKWLNSDKVRRLIVYIIDIQCCIYPLEIMDFEYPYKKGKSKGYNIYNHDDKNALSISKLSEYDIEMWYKYQYTKIVDGKNPYNRVEYKFNDYLKTTQI